MTEKLTRYDPAEDLCSEESISVFMGEAFETGDVAYIMHSHAVIARAEGRAQAPPRERQLNGPSPPARAKKHDRRALVSLPLQQTETFFPLSSQNGSGFPNSLELPFSAH
jgi:hypothetical protein